MNSKKHKLPRRLLAMLLAICMFVTMFPSGMLAEPGGESGSDQSESTVVSTEKSDDYVSIDKTATPGDNPGTWDVTLKVSPKEQDISQLSQDVILVLDTSSSMNYDANKKQTRWKVLQSVLTDDEGIIDTPADAGTRVAVVTFASDNQVDVIGDNFYDLSVQNNVKNLKDSIENFKFGDGRGIDIYAGLAQALELLDSSTSNSSVILLSDGACDIRFEPYGYTEYRDGRYTYDHSGEINPENGKGTYPHNVGRFQQKENYNYSEYLTDYLDDAASKIKVKATLYSISFAGDTDSYGYKTLDRITEDGKLYSSSDYDGLMENFTEITRQILPMIDDPMGEKVEVVGTPTTTLVNAQGSAINTRPAEVVEEENGQSIRWNPNLGQSLEPGQTLTITYTVQLKDTSQKALAELYGEDGNSPQIDLNGSAKLNYYVDNDDQIKSLEFPEPTGTVQVGKLVEDDYVNNVKVEGNTQTSYALVGGNNTFDWDEPDGTITVDGTTYAYQNSTYDNQSIADENKLVVTVGEHHLIHNYGSTLNGTAVTIQVYLDGEPVASPLKDGNTGLVTIERSVGKNDNYSQLELFSNNNGVLTYDFDYNPDPKSGHDCVDINVGFDAEQYVLQGVQYNQSSGSGNPQQVNGSDGAYTIDNVVAGEKMGSGEAYGVDCTIYLYTKYSVQYHLDGQPIGQDQYGGQYVDNNAYISGISVEKSTSTAPTGEKDVAQKVDWKNDGYDTAITLLSLPTVSGSSVSGWFLGNDSTTEFSGEFKQINANSDKADSDRADGVIKFFATSSEYPDLTSITKEVVTEKVDGIEGDYQYPTLDDEGNPQLTVNTGDSVTLLYKITVTGDAGAGFKITDTNAQYVGTTTSGVEIDTTDGITGTIPDGGEVELYVSMNHGTVDANTTLKNTATVENTGNGNDPEEPEATEEVPVVVEQGLKLTYDGNAIGDATVDNVPVDNNTYNTGSTVNLSKKIPIYSEDNVVFIGWSQGQADKIYSAGENYEEDGALVGDSVTFAESDITLYAVWGYDTNGDGIADAQQIIITPADIIIYTGGQEGQNGFDGVVNENNEIVGSTSLPEPGFTVVLPYEIKDTGVTSLKFKEADETTRSWELRPYDGEHTTVYKLVPTGIDPEGGAQDPVRVEFTKADGSRIISSDFTVGLEVNTSFGMNIYRGEVDDTIQVTVEDKTYTVDSDATATLTVRGTTAQAQYASVNAETTDTSAPALAADENTVFTINNSDVTVDSANVALLFDEIIATDADAEGNDRADSLVAKANDVLNASDGDMNYNLKYLDLVDTQNGNAWIKANRDVTIYWPLPEGTTKDTDFTLLHFEGLHRDMDANEVNNMISSCTVDTATTATEGNYIEIVEVTDDYVVIKTGANGFSPFALAWDADNGSSDNPGGWHPSNPGGDGPSGLNTEDHFSYIVGYAEDYRTGEATDDESLWPVKPQNNITRAEVATIFYRLLEDEVRDEYDTTVNNFSDVSADAWYNQTVSTLSSMGIVKGYEDGTFRPNAPITRAEFGAIATRFFEETGATYEPGTFSDVVGDEWFAGAIQDAVNLGLIGGYEDGTVRPNNNITRAEACAIVNRTLGRVPDVDHLLPEDVMKTWPDNPESAWFYADMQEATNGHEYEWITEDGNKVENWTEIMLDNDWTER